MNPRSVPWYPILVPLALVAAGCHDASEPQPPTAQRLYVSAVHSVRIYATPLHPSDYPIDSVVLGGQGVFPGAVAVDRSGNLAVVVGDNIYWYAAPVTHASTQGGSVTPGAAALWMVFGPDGKLYVSLLTGGVVVYKTPLSSIDVPDTLKTGDNGDWGIAFDGAGRLYVGGNSVKVFAPPYKSAALFSLDSLSGIRAIAVDFAGDLLATTASSAVTVFQSPLASGSKPAFSLTSGFSQAIPIAVGPDGTLYVGNENGTTSVVSFTPPLSASSAPTGSIVIPGGIPTALAAGP
jgi:hypothetical protein